MTRSVPVKHTYPAPRPATTHVAFQGAEQFPFVSRGWDDTEADERRVGRESYTLEQAL